MSNLDKEDKAERATRLGIEPDAADLELARGERTSGKRYKMQQDELHTSITISLKRIADWIEFLGTLMKEEKENLR